MDYKKNRKKILGAATIVLATVGTCFVLYRSGFLRRPTRNAPNSPFMFTSPAMGKIVAVHKFDTERIIEEKYDREDNIAGAINLFAGDVDTTGTIISTHLTLTDVHYQRCPVDAKVLKIEYVRGDFKNAISTSKDGLIRYRNEHCSILFESEFGYRFKVVLIAGFVARKIYTFVKVGDTVKQGAVIGVIKMGSQVTTILPNVLEPMVKVGERVTDGETVMAIFYSQDV